MRPPLSVGERDDGERPEVAKEAEMTRKRLVSVMLGAVAVLAAASPLTLRAEEAAEQAAPTVYGRQLMTEQERLEQQARMRAARKEEEREQIREEHHERMQERALERGYTLPDPPMARGGMGPGAGRGAGRW